MVKITWLYDKMYYLQRDNDFRGSIIYQMTTVAETQTEKSGPKNLSTV